MDGEGWIGARNSRRLYDSDEFDLEFAGRIDTTEEIGEASSVSRER